MLGASLLREGAMWGPGGKSVPGRGDAVQKPWGSRARCVTLDVEELGETMVSAIVV